MTLNLQPVPRIPLGRAPLVHVLCQVRFSPTPELVESEAAGLVLRSSLTPYPDHRVEHGVVVQLPPVAPQSSAAFAQRVLRSVDGAWTVTVAADFVALATTRYVDRGDFAQRLRTVLEAVAASGQPAVVERVGVRYVDRVEGPDLLTNLSGLINPRLHGCLDGDDPTVELQQQVVQASLRTETDEITVRSLVMPPNALYDPLVQPVPQHSWVLDIDAFTSARTAFDVEALAGTAARLGEHVHSTFRWAVTDTFLTAYA